MASQGKIKVKGKGKMHIYWVNEGTAGGESSVPEKRSSESVWHEETRKTGVRRLWWQIPATTPQDPRKLSENGHYV
jgi:hypothetical protein